jgi:putative zinc finger/helix-turn-helix YgiT family protein
MVEEHIHDFKEHKATRESPYHFVDSGLPNVYLSGIKYRTCRLCGRQSADIPAIKQLMEVIARTVVIREAALNGAEIRFLRKRLGKKSSEFARIIGVTIEQVSRWENDHNPPEESADKLIRIFYSMLSGDRKLREKIDEDIECWLSTLPGEGQIADIRAKLSTNREWKTESAAVGA